MACHLRAAILALAVASVAAVEDHASMIQAPEKADHLVALFTRALRAEERRNPLPHNGSTGFLDDSRFQNKFRIRWNVSLAEGARLRFTVDGCAWDNQDGTPFSCLGDINRRHSIDAEYYPPMLITEADEAVTTAVASTFFKNGSNWTSRRLPSGQIKTPLCGNHPKTINYDGWDAMGHIAQSVRIGLRPCPTERGWMEVFDGSFDMPADIPLQPTRLMVDVRLRHAGESFANISALVMFNWRSEDPESPESPEDARSPTEPSRESGASGRQAWLGAAFAALLAALAAAW